MPAHLYLASVPRLTATISSAKMHGPGRLNPLPARLDVLVAVYLHCLVLGATLVQHAGASCTPDGGDPWGSGKEIACCHSTKKCLKQSLNWQYRCQSCEDGTGCTDFHLSECLAPPRTAPPRKQGDAVPFKRGFAIKEVNAADLAALAGATSWGYTWEVSPSNVSATTRDCCRSVPGLALFVPQPCHGCRQPGVLLMLRSLPV